MSNGIASSNPQFERVRRVYREYATYRQGDAREMAIASARKLAGGMQENGYGQVDGLYQVTAAIAPTPAEIRADVKAHMQPGHWDIPVQFADGRTGRGTPRQAQGRAWSRKTKGKTAAAKEKFFGKARATTAQVIAFVVALRLNATLYLASGWLGAIEDLGGRIPSGDSKRSARRSGVDHERGGATVRESPGLLEVEFWNRTPGIAEQDAKHGLVRQAVDNWVADTRAYMDRKRREWRQWRQEHGIAA